jgi:dipeptidyl aminopeptidase/acylaminoacyl peptidase
MLNIGALLAVPYVDTEMGFDLSPDGRRVAFSWNPDGRWEIYELSLDRPEKPRKLSSGPGGKFSPRYSPDGTRLGFVVDFDGGENYHLFLHDFHSHRQKDLTPRVKSALQSFFAWSPDGTRIAYISDASGQFNTYVMQLSDGIRPDGHDRLVLDAGHPAWKVRWSPDGAWLAVTAEASGVDFGTYLVPSGGGEPRRLSDRNGPLNAKDACWSPDSRTLAFCSDVSGNYQIGIYELRSGGITWVTQGDGQNESPAWSPDGRRLAYVHHRGAVSWVAVQTPGGPALTYQVEDGVHYLPRFTVDGKMLLLGFDNPRHPTDLWLVGGDGQKTQVTHSMPSELAQGPFLMPQEIVYPGLDGTPVPALLFQPQVEEPGPAVLLIHGGPDWLFQMTWYPLMTYMASRGWVVLVPNYRGSTGYGRAWQLASRFDFGGVDRDDVTAGAHYLAREKLADPGRIAITGRSHGGYLTACCMTGYPELWAAGSAVVPFLNWFTNHDEIRPDLKHWDVENFGDPVENYDRWRERSPSFFLDRIQAPLQLICAGSDARCPISDSLEARDALLQMGKEIDFVLYENEGHTFLKMENLLDAEQRRLKFLIKHLEDGSSLREEEA